MMPKPTRPGVRPCTAIIHTTPWMETARRMYERLGFVRRPDRDAPYEQWNGASIAGLPDAWIGQPFLAYTAG